MVAGIDEKNEANGSRKAGGPENESGDGDPAGSGAGADGQAANWSFDADFAAGGRASHRGGGESGEGDWGGRGGWKAGGGGDVEGRTAGLGEAESGGGRAGETAIYDFSGVANRTAGSGWGNGTRRERGGRG